MQRQTFLLQCLQELPELELRKESNLSDLELEVTGTQAEISLSGSLKGLL